MNLTEQLAREQDHWAPKIPAAPAALLVGDLERLRNSELPDRALKAGERAPNFRLPDANGRMVELDDLRARGPVVLVFYRGQWCPYCNLELRAYQQLLPAFDEAGTTLVAISPQTPDHSLSTVEKNALAFPVLSDVGSNVARAYGLAFDLDDEMQRLYSDFFGNDLSRYNGSGAISGWTLPLPATYLVGRDARIQLAHVDVDYRRRLDPLQLFERLQKS
ncbi:peroxiredoxin-like family protein [Nevskia sp.]|uniref:peroxiredoxin-like family protein n=1 Tax=Nevskia sp. TaxID=1929292 RepID=UPI0025F7FA65|nr:peroxiredoxin-like family protein [Nevskia sp.]